MRNPNGDDQRDIDKFEKQIKKKQTAKEQIENKDPSNIYEVKTVDLELD